MTTSKWSYVTSIFSCCLLTLNWSCSMFIKPLMLTPVSFVYPRSCSTGAMEHVHSLANSPRVLWVRRSKPCGQGGAYSKVRRAWKPGKSQSRPESFACCWSKEQKGNLCDHRYLWSIQSWMSPIWYIDLTLWFISYDRTYLYRDRCGWSYEAYGRLARCCESLGSRHHGVWRALLGVCCYPPPVFSTIQVSWTAFSFFEP